MLLSFVYLYLSCRGIILTDNTREYTSIITIFFLSRVYHTQIFVLLCNVKMIITLLIIIIPTATKKKTPTKTTLLITIRVW